MPLFHPSILISDAYGSAGEVSWYHRNGKCYIRKRSHSPYGATPRQLDHLAVHRRALQAWRGLEHEIQLEWNQLATEVEPHKPPFDHSAHISGQNLFVSAYHGFVTLGNEHLPFPQRFEPFPPFGIQMHDAAIMDGTLLIPASVILGAVPNPERYKLLAKIQLTEPGRGCHPGMMRNYLADETCETDNVHIRIPVCISRNSLDLEEYQVYGRFLLLDTVTGYRSQLQKHSAVIKVK